MRTHRQDHGNTPARSGDLSDTAPPATFEESRLVNARVAGVLYLVIIVFGLFSELVMRSRLIVTGDATATAKNVLAAEWLVHTVIAANLVSIVCEVALTIICYLLFKPVSNALSLLAAAFRLVSLPIYAGNLLNIFSASLVLGDIHGFGANQPADLALFLLDLHRYGYAIGLVFFGVNCLIMGRLLVRSTHAPRPLGILLGVAGLGYLTNSFMYVLISGYNGSATAPLLAPALVAETWFCLLLLWKGGGIHEWGEPGTRPVQAH
jgi:hypothetical protein